MPAVWIPLLAQPNRERWAQENILRQPGYDDCYYPVTEEQGKVRPLFGRYMFAHSVTGAWRSLSGTFGVACVVTFGELPGYVPDRLILVLRQAENNQGVVTLPERPKFTHGDPVRAVSGPFVGITGIYQGMSKRSRVQVLLSIMGRETPVEFKEVELERV